jgi:hypothetical protein
MNGPNFLGICTIVAFMATFLSAIVASYFGFRAILNPRPDGPHRRLVKLWRLNALLFADELSTIGQGYRARHLSAVKATFCSMAVLAGLAVTLALIKTN